MSISANIYHNNVAELSHEVNIIRNQIIPQLQGVCYYSQSIIGDFKYSARSNDHLGWLYCDGRSVDRTTYKSLFEVIGTTFGSSNATSFMLPDFRGRVAGTIGAGSNLTNRALGDSVGTETHTLIVDEIPSHSHTITDPGHTHTLNVQTGNQSTDNAFGTETAGDNTVSNNTTSSSTTGITVNNTGGGLPHNNMQPTLFGGKVFIFSGMQP